jgi:hypothetical protein
MLPRPDSLGSASGCRSSAGYRNDSRSARAARSHRGANGFAVAADEVGMNFPLTVATATARAVCAMSEGRAPPRPRPQFGLAKRGILDPSGDGDRCAQDAFG